MDESDKKFFDISKPQRPGPTPTSKPIIVTQHPEVSDSMIKEEPPAQPPPSRVSVPVMSDMSAPAEPIPALTPTAPVPPPQPAMTAPAVAPEPQTVGQPAQIPGPIAEPVPEIPVATAPPLPPSEPVPPPAPVPEPTMQYEATPAAQTMTEPQLSVTGTMPPPPPPENLPNPPEPPAQRDELHVPAGTVTYHHKPRVWAWLLAILLLVAGVYAALDLKTDIRLPYEIFKNIRVADSTNNSNPQPAQPTNQNPADENTVSYQPEGTPIVFSYPKEWGDAKTTNDPGFSERGAGKKSDGVHAYLVSFSKNADIEIAITSARYLPAARTPLYYDFLQWCEGTNDSTKIFKTRLLHTAEAGVDTPSTTSCDQGPLTDAKKINNGVIVQANTKDADGASLGDLYTANLSGDKFFVVFRVKDAKMQNGKEIEALLGTIAGAPQQ